MSEDRLTFKAKFQPSHTIDDRIWLDRLIWTSWKIISYPELKWLISILFLSINHRFIEDIWTGLSLPKVHQWRTLYMLKKKWLPSYKCCSCCWILKLFISNPLDFFNSTRHTYCEYIVHLQNFYMLWLSAHDL